MNTEIKAPGEKYAIENNSLYGYLDSPHATFSQGRAPHTLSTAHLSSDTNSVGFAFDSLVSFCALLLNQPLTDQAVFRLASNVLTLVDAKIGDLQRRVKQLLPTITFSEFEQLKTLAENVHQQPKENLTIVDSESEDEVMERSTVNYAHRLQPIKPIRESRKFPGFIEHNQDMSQLEYDDNITPFDSEQEE
ncbi:hypothetical protein G6F56_005449 [Rhizopus delemar]|uniref:Uncharacterized protein n=1 Tax=Rhizopus stolonifer TaxID=4846 RepID=A0A367KY86_RHIST|nr:hypothetical protein G6F56_005449 [Rhizopus delemar]RCI07179.1 hypothetical protein CU098_013923 [Rhizopus stolonifer]